eukprot:CAMPEP_0198583876 /NCGR_PEP_ID=MMETSP1462-20131121/127313_1 /TAXON_ID=1333877 /ORGANISM="Brandtodinium nutriculum, Strain RCC3387" /LENGTH=141 /DNA_ID=CAMNT_0044315285 /DNA_START=42 /DNA_END=464 /DNA_ORIENTATION=-
MAPVNLAERRLGRPQAASSRLVAVQGALRLGAMSSLALHGALWVGARGVAHAASTAEPAPRLATHRLALRARAGLAMVAGRTHHGAVGVLAQVRAPCGRGLLARGDAHGRPADRPTHRVALGPVARPDAPGVAPRCALRRG